MSRDQLESTAPLAGKVARVTGASRGIDAAGGRALRLRADVTDSVSVRALVARTVDELSGLDIAVNNAGGGFAGRAPIGDVPEDEFRQRLELNLTSVFVAIGRR